MAFDIQAIQDIWQDRDKRSVVILAGCLVAVILFLLFAAIPQAGSRIIQGAGIRKMKAEIAVLDAEVKRIDSYQKALVEHKDKIGSYRNLVLFHEGEIPGVLEELSSMARDSGVKVIGIKPAKAPGLAAAKGATISEVPIIINARGGYHETGSLVGRIESGAKFLKIADIDVKGNRTSPKKHEISLLVLAHLLPGEKPKNE